jgi:predicted nucleotidyltransferase
MTTLSDSPIDVDERLSEVTFKLTDRKTADEMIAMLEEAKRKHLKLKWSNVKVGLERRSKEEIDLVIYGSRLEDTNETQARLNETRTRQKFVEEQELKEYLRLKRKFEGDKEGREADKNGN